jgi:hypothetical protein
MAVQMRERLETDEGGDPEDDESGDEDDTMGSNPPRRETHFKTDVDIDLASPALQDMVVVVKGGPNAVSSTSTPTAGGDQSAEETMSVEEIDWDNL